jgi:hypothetical protein
MADVTTSANSTFQTVLKQAYIVNVTTACRNVFKAKLDEMIIKATRYCVVKIGKDMNAKLRKDHEIYANVMGQCSVGEKPHNG